MLSGNYFMIMIMLKFIYLYMYVCIYLCHYLIGIVRDHSCEGINAYATEWHEEVPGS